MTIKSILTKTLHILKRDGWAQGCGTSSNGGHCIDDAVWRGFVETAEDRGLDPFVFGFDWSLRHAASRSLFANRPLGDKDWTLVHWNDNPVRTYQEVVELIETAIKYSND